VVFCPQCGTRMADEANFCLNCGENLSKWRTNSGFVKEQADRGAGEPPGRQGAQGEPRAGREGRSGQGELEVTIGGRGVSHPTGAVRQLNAMLTEARGAAEAGNLEAAVENFRAALSIDPEAHDAWYGLGVVYGRLGRQLDALSAFNRLIESNPRLAAAYDGKGTALFHLGRFGEAVAAFDDALRIEPTLVSARLEKGIALARSEDLRGAVACFDAVLEVEPSNEAALIHRSDALLRSNDTAGALHSLDRALEVAPLNGGAWRKKGDLLLKMGHPSDARRCYERALQLDANDFEALVRRGDAMRQAGDPAGAIDSYERAVALRGARAEPHVRKGLLYFALSQFPAARDCFARARELEPDHQVAAVNYAVSLYRCREFEHAKGAAESALGRWPGQVDLARVLAASERKLASGKSPATGRLVQPPGQDHTVEDIFLIYRDGRLIAHQTRRLRADMDNQLLSGMLTAIQSFIQEAFRESEEGQLNEMAFGRNQILIERGRWISLAVVIRGVPPVGARAELSFAVESLEQKYRTALEGWDGEAQSLRGVADAMRRVLEVL
jgi:tetratricopeptide (TPR) repeat protein